VIARLSRRVVMVIMVMMLMTLVVMIIVVCVVMMIAKAVSIASRDDSDRSILLPATPNAAKLAC
jgi:hypothetical protein